MCRIRWSRGRPLRVWVRTREVGLPRAVTRSSVTLPDEAKWSPEEGKAAPQPRQPPATCVSASAPRPHPHLVTPDLQMLAHQMGEN